MFVLHLLLALAWLLLTGVFTPVNFAFGLLAAYGVLWFCWRAVVPEPQGARLGYFRKVGQVLAFGLFFVWELILANLRVAIDVLRPRMQFAPAVVAVPLRDFSDAETVMLANLITLTPGTLSLDVRDDPPHGGRILYVHAMHGGRTQAVIDRFRQQLQQNFGRRVQEVMRS